MKAFIRVFLLNSEYEYLRLSFSYIDVLVRDGNSDLETFDITSGWLFYEVIREFYTKVSTKSLSSIYCDFIPVSLSTR